ncbi:MAG TPA: CvpA family protein [Cryomorphaceae bacterium]|nr:CvpA family protein [Cryomorphaceae bacterium]
MILDICILLPVLWGMFKGFKRGLIIELCTLMALVLGVYGAATFGEMGSDYLRETFNTDPRVSGVLGFALLFIIIVILVFIFGKVLEGVIKLVALGLINKLFGLLFGGLKFLLIVSGLLYLINGFPLTEDLIPAKEKADSYLYEPASEILPSIYPTLAKTNWRDQLEDTLDDIKEGINFN